MIFEPTFERHTLIHDDDDISPKIFFPIATRRWGTSHWLDTQAVVWSRMQPIATPGCDDVEYATWLYVTSVVDEIADHEILWRAERPIITNPTNDEVFDYYELQQAALVKDAWAKWIKAASQEQRPIIQSLQRECMTLDAKMLTLKEMEWKVLSVDDEKLMAYVHYQAMINLRNGWVFSTNETVVLEDAFQKGKLEVNKILSGEKSPANKRGHLGTCIGRYLRKHMLKLGKVPPRMESQPVREFDLSDPDEVVLSQVAGVVPGETRISNPGQHALNERIRNFTQEIVHVPGDSPVQTKKKAKAFKKKAIATAQRVCPREYHREVAEKAKRNSRKG